MKCICGKEFAPSKFKPDHRFCSNRCRMKNFERIGSRAVRYRAAARCVICAAEFQTFKHRPAETCSMTCRIALWKDTCQLMREVGLSK